MADVPAVADPNTGVAVFAPSGAASVFLVFGGTSVAAPVIAAVYAVNGGMVHAGGSDPYAHTASLFDVTSGSNGSCSPTYLCRARRNGTSAF